MSGAARGAIWERGWGRGRRREENRPGEMGKILVGGGDWGTRWGLRERDGICGTRWASLRDASRKEVVAGHAAVGRGGGGGSEEMREGVDPAAAMAMAVPCG